MSFAYPGITHCIKHGNRIGLDYICEECEKEKNKMTIGDKYRNEINNKELGNDEIAKTIANALKKLTEAERTILKNIDKDYKWIARDESGKLFVYEDKPERTSSFRSNDWWGGNYESVAMFNHLFQFITWNDSEPYNIAELLKGE